MKDIPSGNRAWPKRIAAAASPVWTVFVGSVLLSLIAIGPNGTINSDGMLYVDTARIFLQGGFAAAREVFPWPFLPILMAVVSQATGLGLQTTGYLLNVLFLAGACAFLVACAARLFPKAVWLTCLVLLSVPGLNDYRNEVLREYGCWFFLMFSFWLALRWSEAPRWRSALAVQASLGVAVLFRPEALAFFPALILWQLVDSPRGERWRRLLMIGGVPLIGLITLVALYAGGQLTSGRLAGDLGRLSLARFDAKAEAIAASLHEYAREQARTILLFGSLAIIPLKFIKQMGIFVVPLLFLLSGQSLRQALSRSQIFIWAFLVHLLVLMVFVTDMQFLAGRYVALLTLLAVPITGYGLWLLIERFPRWKLPVVVVALLIMVVNVLPLSPGKVQYIEAGAWLAKNVSESPRIYIESSRTAYYAGWRFAVERPDPKRRALNAQALAQGQYDLAVLEISHKEPDITPWLGSAGLKEVRRFSHPNGDAVIIAEPVAGRNQESAAKTSRIREKTGSIE